MANHWIPFTESEVDAKDAYQSHFMVEFLRRVGGAVSGRAGPAGYRDPENPAPSQGLLFDGAHGFGEERGGRRNPEAACNASQEYTRLIGALRAAERTLAARIAPKVRQHGFLR